MGAWIEILIYIFAKKIKKVAPHMGAWIEIDQVSKRFPCCNVAPHMGAWIEIYAGKYALQGLFGRTPHGCVD